MKKRSIGYRLFSSTMLILLISIIITALFGSSLVENFYMHSKKTELESAYTSIKYGLNQDNNDDLAQTLYNIERKNINALIFTTTNINDTNAISIIYNSRNYILNDEKPSNFPKNFFNYNTIIEWLNKLTQDNYFVNNQIYINDQDKKNSIELYTIINDDIYLFLSTPKEQITLAANMAVKYYIVLTLFTMLFMAIASYFQAKRFSKPISQMAQTATRISQMDFSTPCNITTGDELETLSQSINTMAVTLNDYINQLHLNQSLLKKDLEREAKSNAMRKEFIANVSHDFKTPLTLIQAYSENLLEQCPNNPQIADNCQILLKETARMSTLVTQLLQLSKLESGMSDLQISLFPIDEDIYTLMHANQILLKQKNITATVNINETEEHLVYGDYNRILNVLQNLIDNAIKYCPQNGNITINSQIINNKYQFSILNDITTPLTDEQLADIFTSFHRLDKARTPDGKSYGLGLAVVKAIMELHQQQYGAYNLENQICFYFTLDYNLPTIDDNYEEINKENDTDYDID